MTTSEMHFTASRCKEIREEICCLPHQFHSNPELKALFLQMNEFIDGKRSKTRRLHQSFLDAEKMAKGNQQLAGTFARWRKILQESKHEVMNERLANVVECNVVLQGTIHMLKRKKTDLQINYDDLKVQYDDVMVKYDDLTVKYDDLRVKYGDLRVKYGDLEMNHDDLTVKYDDITVKYDDLTVKYDDIAVKMDDLEEEYDDLE